MRLTDLSGAMLGTVMASTPTVEVPHCALTANIPEPRRSLSVTGTSHGQRTESRGFCFGDGLSWLGLPWVWFGQARRDFGEAQE